MRGRVTMIAALALLLAPPAVAPARSAAGPGRFPADFLWGVSTSGFQSEGSFPDSNWTRYAKRHEPYLNSADFRHRYPEDIQRARDLGAGVFRTSIEWSRVEPAPGHRDPAALAYYDDLIKRIKDAGLRPMITLDHWVYPGWIADRGGWTAPGTAAAWLRNAEFVVDRYRGQGITWITFNEASQYIFFETTERRLNPFQSLAMRNALIKTHRAAYDMIHRVDPGAMVSTNVAYGPAINWLLDAAVFNAVTDKLDFIGIDYYYGLNAQNLSVRHTLTGELWKIDPEPEGIYYVLRNYQRRLPHLPVYVVENGMSTDDGKPRPDGYTRADHLRDHLYWVQRALADGVRVIGYNYWSITDNYEWGSYRPRFGLYTVDVKTDPRLTRRPTDAVPAYRDIIAARGVPAGYVPVRKPGWCSAEDPIATCLTPPRTPPAPPSGSS